MCWFLPSPSSAVTADLQAKYAKEVSHTFWCETSFWLYRELFTFAAALVATVALFFPVCYEDGVATVTHLQWSHILHHQFLFIGIEDVAMLIASGALAKVMVSATVSVSLSTSQMDSIPRFCRLSFLNGKNNQRTALFQ